jgi:UDP-N-acetylmuramoyl-tripeptide--D-alanyl-D-alanine ligase
MHIQKLHQLFSSSTGISTDTRSLEKGALFFALKGENFNGNLFAEKALSQEAIAIVVDDINLKNLAPNVIIVEDVLETLQELARFHRKKLNTPIIALTGSNGKTTTKELIREVFSKKYKVLATKGNLNNHIGVPLTLLELKEEHQIAIIEMGANHQGEIKILCEIALPNWGYITNFGKAHLEGFGGVKGVIKGKSELYKHLIERGQKILINIDDPIQKRLTENYPVSSFGNGQDSTFKITKEENTSTGLKVSFNEQTFSSPLHGAYNLNNIAAAVIFGHIYKIPTEEIQSGIQQYVATNNRSQKIKIKNTSIILDAYNANPTSMEHAIKAFEKIGTLKSMVILGDMMELGQESEKEHQDILDYCLKTKFKYIHLIGAQFSETATSKALKHKDLETFKKYIRSLSLEEFDHVLIKGSRSMKLETLLPLFESKL